MLSNEFLVKDIEETIKPNPEVPIRALKDQLEKKYQLGISDNKIYRAKAKASMKVLGDFTEQYAILRDYVLELQRTNPDTTVKLDVERTCNPVDPTRQFRRIYICLGALKKGFKAGMRDLLGLDGCFMKGQYPGQLLSVVGVDANHGTYPLAYAIVEAETLNSWSWFLTCLGDDLDLTRESNFTFISDRQKGLIPALAQVFPCAEHRFCLRRIHENMKVQFRGDLYKELLWNCACATSMPYFEKHMEKLKQADEKAYEWLNKIPPQHWSRAHFSVEAETLNSWSWFLTCLGDDLDLTRESNFTFISDRQKGLIPALAQVFPCAEHRFCLRRIHENMKVQFRGDLYKELLWNCACATSMPYFEKHMEKLKQADEKAYEWLNKIPPQHWSRAHFSGRAHCDMLLNNICEVFNRRLVDGRDVPIITCLEFVREYLMNRIVKVQQLIDKAKGPLTPDAAALFKSITDEASFYKVLWNGDYQYQVTGPFNDQCVVDVREKTCSCRKWELTGMPCKRAVVALWDRAGNKSDVGTPESWVHACYWLVTWKKVYSNKINPLNGKDLWKKHPCPNTLIPPKVHPQIGRPSKKRKKSSDELSSQKMSKGGKLSRARKTVTCDICKTPGHNKRSSKGGVGGSQRFVANPSQASQGSVARGPPKFAETPRQSQASAARGPQRKPATPRPSQASASRGPQRKAATPIPSQASAATPRASQRSRAPQRSTAFYYF